MGKRKGRGEGKENGPDHSPPPFPQFHDLVSVCLQRSGGGGGTGVGKKEREREEQYKEEKNKKKILFGQTHDFYPRKKISEREEGWFFLFRFIREILAP